MAAPLQPRAQRAVLLHVLARHPDHLTVPELVREMTADSEELAASDAAEQAVRDLAGVGLLHCHRGIVSPTRAAIRLDAMGFFRARQRGTS